MKGLLAYKRTLVLSDVLELQKVCVPSSQYVVVVHHKGQKLSLLRLTSVINTSTIHTINANKSTITDVTSVAENKIATTHDEFIIFYHISDNELVESSRTNVKERCWEINCFDETLFASTTQPDKVIQFDLTGTVLRTLYFPTKVFNSCTSYNPVTKHVYFVSDRYNGLLAMTLEGEITTVLEGMPEIDDITVTETGDVYVVGKDGVYIVNMDTGDAIKFGKSYETNVVTPCMSYFGKQSELFVACEDFIDIYTADLSKG